MDELRGHIHTADEDTRRNGLVADLSAVIGAAFVFPGDDRSVRAALHDATELRGIAGAADAIVHPGSVDEVARVVSWCYEHDVPIVCRGGGTGLAGGAVPDAGVVVQLDRLSAVRSLDPEFWRMEAEAGVRTETVHRLARENGLMFPPDPGAGEQSTLGGNIATNAGGPHAFKYGVTGTWVTGLEVVIPPGEVIRAGGPIRKDVAGYDLVRLFAGSEGTLGLITSAWLRLVPSPEVVLPVAAFFADAAAGAAAIARVMASGVEAAALEFLDAGALDATRRSFPTPVPEEARFLVLAEADGEAREAARIAGELAEALGDDALELESFKDSRAIRELWRWRDGISIAVAAKRGGKISEDIVVPLDRLAEAIDRTVQIGARHGLEACSWGHAGDGNLHSTFLIDPSSQTDLERGNDAAADLFALAMELGGSITGEHGVGTVKVPYLHDFWSPALHRLQREIKRAFDPKGLMNPGKKVVAARVR